MNIKRFSVFIILLFGFAVPCFAHHMAVIVNKENAVDNISAAHLAKIFHSDTKKWPDGKLIVVVVHSNNTGEMETLERLIKVTADEWKTFIATHKDSIQVVDSDEDVRKAVQAIPGAVGLVDVRAVDGSIRVVRVDGKLPMESGYLPH
jgi:ABC-type phosphate transport system substrate-binding protein